MFFPSSSARKMKKDSPNHIPENMIGLAYTLRKIHEYGYILIFLASFYSSDPVWYVTGSKVGITLSTFSFRGYYNIYVFRRSVPECDIFFFLYSREKNT